MGKGIKESGDGKWGGGGKGQIAQQGRTPKARPLGEYLI